jgi:hypothetical protein
MSKIIDNLNITDEIGPNGLVIIKDKDGNILVKKHNMVVKGGKKIVYEKLLEMVGFSNGGNGYIAEGNSNWRLGKLYFGNSMNETTFDYETIDKIESGQDDVYYYSYSLINGTSYSPTMGFGMTNDGHPYLEFNLSSILCDPSKASYLSCLSVVAEEIVAGTDGKRKEKLFSRIKFDPIPMIEGNELTLLYYIYF